MTDLEPSIVKMTDRLLDATQRCIERDPQHCPLDGGTPLGAQKGGAENEDPQMTTIKIHNQASKLAVANSFVEGMPVWLEGFEPEEPFREEHPLIFSRLEFMFKAFRAGYPPHSSSMGWLDSNLRERGALDDTTVDHITGFRHVVGVNFISVLPQEEGLSLVWGVTTLLGNRLGRDGAQLRVAEIKRPFIGRTLSVGTVRTYEAPATMEHVTRFQALIGLAKDLGPEKLASSESA